MAAPTIAVPGDRLGTTSSAIAGVGTHTRDGIIYASLAGSVHTLPADAASSGGSVDPSAVPLPVISVTRESADTIVVPEVGSVVAAKVTRITAQAANMDILLVNGAAVHDTFTGVVRRENVRDTEIDKIKMDETFRPGDIVVARVVSLGDARSYTLSTAGDAFGVVYAVSEAGTPMRPVAADELEDPATGKREKRKLAVVLP